MLHCASSTSGAGLAVLALFSSDDGAGPGWTPDIRLQSMEIIDPLAGAQALNDCVKAAATAGAQLLPGVSETRVVGRGAFGAVLVLFSGSGRAGRKASAAAFVIAAPAPPSARRAGR